ncbi:TfoX/Sxy family protein [Nocardia sp. NPDC088792]|uniref:TfoX/Sxy family protein n=1 Tax=Nocardia sp. NPDC088792 TaxID=3364332 RepID=UPI0038151262
MAYDEELAERIRDVLGPRLGDVTEKKMFGGLSFMVGGNLAVAVRGKAGLLARVGVEQMGKWQQAGSVEPAVMGGREMHGWLSVSPEAVADDKSLGQWVDRCLAYAGTLPRK